MTAKEALAISKRKVNPCVIDAIYEAARQGKKKIPSYDIPDNEIFHDLTEEDRKWLIENGYSFRDEMVTRKAFERDEEGMYSKEDCDIGYHEHICWDLEE